MKTDERRVSASLAGLLSAARRVYLGPRLVSERLWLKTNLTVDSRPEDYNVGQTRVSKTFTCLK